MTMQRVMNEMKVNAPSVPCGTSLIEVVALFAKHQINAIPVINPNHKVIGFVSESDCMKVVASNHNQCTQMS